MTSQSGSQHDKSQVEDLKGVGRASRPYDDQSNDQMLRITGSGVNVTKSIFQCHDLRVGKLATKGEQIDSVP